MSGLFLPALLFKTKANTSIARKISFRAKKFARTSKAKRFAADSSLRRRQQAEIDY